MNASIPCSEEEYFYKVDNMVLSSCQHVRTVFKWRWKAESGSEWVDNKECMQKFLQDLGKTALKKVPAFQKKTLNESSGLEEWDMSLLSIVIQNFGDEKKYEKENLGLRNLKNMRNELAHHTTKKFTREEYTEHVHTFKDAMVCLGMTENTINKLIERAGVTSSLKAYERMKVMFGEAEKLMKANKFDNAIEIYTDAINTPSLLPVNLGEGYEKRAYCYLKSEKNQVIDGKHCDQALVDVKQALELNSSSWNAHYLAAQCYRRKNNLSKAISHYEKSVAISPGQKRVKRDLDSCRVLAGVHSREEHMDPRKMPMNLDERVKHLERETGIKMSGEKFIKMNRNYAGRIVPGQDHVFKGHQYSQGWGVEQNFTEAVKYYAKADAIGNPDGSYNLAQCYAYGRGVEQNLDKALQIYRRVAEMDTNLLGEMTPTKCNLAVALSQHSIGLMYDNGIGVGGKDCAEAAKWYKRAMDNGVGQSANNLGILYFRGEGVPVNLKMAEMCWKDAINLKDVNAPAALMSYYLSEMEPEKALNMFRIGREMGNSDLNGLSNEEFGKIISEVKSERKNHEGLVVEYEKQKGLETKGLTFKERLDRAMLKENKNLEKMEQIAENRERNHLGLGTHNNSWGGKVQGLTIEVMKTIYCKAFAGSETASRVCSTFMYCNDLNEILDNSEQYSVLDKMKMVELLYNCATLEFHLVFFKSTESRQKLKSVIAQLFDEKCGTKGDEDMKIRLCYCRFNLWGSFQSSKDYYALEILREGVRRYPDNPSYHDLYLCCLGFKQKYKEGAACAAVALESFPRDPDLLYDRAVLLRFCRGDGVSNPEILQAFKNFLSVAPCDHRKVPEAYYQMSNVYLEEFVVEGGSESKFVLVEKAFADGLDAETRQLPCYLPYGESDSKAYVAAVIAEKKQRENPLREVPKVKLNPVVSVLERKGYLKGAVRKLIIKQHRLHLHHSKPKGLGVVVSHSVAPKLRQTVPKKLSNVKPIRLLETNPTQDKIFENRILELVIVDEPNPLPTSIHLVAEDDAGDITRLYVYNVENDVESLCRFQVGSRIAIINPYMRIGAQSITNGIRNDEPRCIVYLEGVVSMCRFCGEANARSKCSVCKRPYCSRECQVLDWKELNHKLVCSLEMK